MLLTTITGPSRRQHFKLACDTNCDLLPSHSMTWHALLLCLLVYPLSFCSFYLPPQIFLFRFPSVSLHCSPIQFSLAFFMHLLMLLFTSLYFFDPSGSNVFFLSSLLLSHRSKNSAVIQGFSSDDVCQGSHWLFQSLLC